MAEETKDQQEAQTKSAIPDPILKGMQESVQASADARGEHLKRMEKGKEIATKYGEPDFQALLTKVGSDSIFAQRLVEDLVSGDDTITVGLLPDSPQQLNVTGKVDHTQDTPTKLKSGASTSNPVPETPAAAEPVATGEKVN